MILQQSGEAQVVTEPPVQFHRSVLHGFAAGDEITVDVAVPVTELQCIAWAKPIGTPSLKALSFSTDPTANEIALVGVEVMIKAVVINEMTAITR